MNLGWFVALAATGIAHAIWVPVANCALAMGSSRLAVDLDAVAYLLAGEYKDDFVKHVAPLTHHPYAVLAYFGSMYFVAGAVGVLLHWVIRKYDLDRRYRLLRFNNKWHYLFSGEDKGVSAVVVTVTCHHNDHTCLYAGLLDTFVFNGDGQLERLVLLSAARAQLCADPEIRPKFSRIEGDKFLIWCHDINTLNVTYLHEVPRRRRATDAMPHKD